MAKFSNKNEQQLKDLLEEKREQLREMRFNISGAEDTAPSDRQKLKKDVARILTELRQRQLQIQ